LYKKKLIQKYKGTREYLWVSKYLWITRIEIPAWVWGRARVPYLSNGAGTNIILHPWILIDIPRPDLAFIIGVLGKYLSNPGIQPWTVVKLVMRYLKRTRDFILTY